MELPLTGHRPQRPSNIDISTLNIWDGRGFGLVQAIQSVERGGFDLMLLTDIVIYWRRAHPTPGGHKAMYRW